MTDTSELDHRLDAEPVRVDPSTLFALLELSPDGMAVLEGDVAPDARIQWSNDAFDRLLGGERSPSGRSLGDLAATLPGDVTDALVEAARWGDALVRSPNGSVVAARIRSVPTGRPGAPSQWAVVASASREEVGDEALRASEERFRALAANAPIGVFFSEVGLRLGYVNDRFAELWGQPASDVLGMGWLESVHPADTTALIDALSAVLAGDTFDLVVRVFRRSDGEMRWLRTRSAPVRLPGHGAGFVGSLEDVTDARRHEELLAHQATHDPLTGLPNRTLLWERLAETLGSFGRAPRYAGRPPAREVALLFFDLDDFKLVNDTLGHQAGDDLLKTVAERLTDGVRPDDMVVRLGGDEFVVLCEVASGEEATAIAERLQGALTAPVILEGTEVAVSASVGVVVADGSHDPEGLLRDADVAMYQAKQAGKARFAVFDERVRTAMQERLALTGDLRRALAGNELAVVYQPIWDVRADRPRIVGLEALVRWQHPERGPIPPPQIIALAEEHGLIDDLGSLVLRRACTDLARWRRELGHLAPEQVSVNLCTAQLRHPGLLPTVGDALRRSGLEGPDLCLELTETVVMDDIDGSLVILDALRSLGVSLAVDDFGTGYSSLAYLQRLPVQTVKIDRSFVGHLEENESDAAIVAAIVAMAEALRLTAVAEGVELPGQLSRLRGLGCAQAQGYLLSRPVAAADIPGVLSRQAA